MSLLRSHQTTRDSITGRDNVRRIPKVSRSDVTLDELPTKISFQNIGDAFVLGHTVNGVLGTANGSGGGQITLGTADYGALTTQAVINYQNTFKEYFRDSTFIDTTNTSATVDLTTFQVDFDNGKKLYSEIIFTDGDLEVPEATFITTGGTATPSSPTVLNYYLSTDDLSSLYGYWPLVAGLGTDESGNNHDGTLSTGVVLEPMTATTNFSSVANASFSVNTNSLWEGGSAVNVYTSATGENNLGFDVDFGVTDLSDKAIAYYLYIKDQTTLDKISSIVMYLYSATDRLGGAVGWNKFSMSASYLRVGKNIIRIEVENPDSIESDGAVATIIEKLRIRIYKGTSVEFAEGDLVVNYLQHGYPMKTQGPSGNEDVALAFTGNRYYSTASATYRGGSVNLDIPANGTDLALDYTESFSIGCKFRTRYDYVKQASNDVSLFAYGFSCGLKLSSGDVVQGGLRLGGTTNTLVGTSNVNDQLWHSVVMTYDANTRGMVLWVDAVQEDTETNTVDFDTTTSSLNIANKVFSGNTQTFNGDICSAFVVGTVMTSAQISDYHNSTEETIFNGSNWWEEVSLGTAHRFTHIGKKLRYRIDSSGDVSIGSRDSEGYDFPLKIIYKTRS